MTKQAAEVLILNGEKTSINAKPLQQYLQTRKEIKFKSHSTACYRGYEGTWEIKDNKLFLVRLKASVEGHDEVGLSYLFPGEDIVFANWFNGNISIDQGKMLDYVHMGNSLYEKNFVMNFTNGVLVNQYVIDNELEYQARVKKRLADQELWEKQKPSILRKEKLQNFLAKFTVITFIVLVLFGVCAAIYYSFIWGAVLGYIVSAIVLGGVILLFVRIITVRKRNKQARLNQEK